MAQLTSNIGGINPQTPIRDPGPRPGGFLSGLAGFGEDLIKSYADKTRLDDANNSRDMQNAAAAGIANVERGIEISKASPVPDAPTFDSVVQPLSVQRDINVPLDVKKGVDELDRAKKAVDQGRAPTDMLQIGLERLVSELQAKYPEQQAQLFQYMSERGYDHFLFRATKQDEALAKASDQADVVGRQYVMEAAYKAGLALPGMGPEAIYQAGQKYLETTAKAELAQKAAAAAKEAATQGREDYKFLQGEADRKMYDSAISAVNTQKSVIQSWLLGMQTTAGDDAGKHEELLKIAPEMHAYIQIAKNKMQGDLAAHGASKDIIDSAMKAYDDADKEITDAYFGPTSRQAIVHQSLQNMKDRLALDAEKALPTYSMLVRILGQGGVAQAFGADPTTAFSPELIGKLRAELRNYDPTKPNEGITTLYRIGELIKGNGNLKSIPESQITPDYVRGLNAAARGAARNILDPEPDNPVEQSQFLNSYANVGLAASSIQPGFKDLNALDYAVGSIADPNNIAVLERLAKDPVQSDKARSVIQLGRASAAQLLEVGKTAVNLPDQRVVFKNGSFVVQVDKPTVEGFVKQGLSRNTAISMINTGHYKQPTINPDIQKQANVLNGALNYLVRTAPFDDSVAGKYKNARELRDHYGAGMPLGKPPTEADKGKPAKTFEQSVDEFKTQLEQGILSGVSDSTPSFKSPADAIARTIIGEAGNQGEHGMAAVGYVIKNRMASSGQSAEQVVLAPNQFEPWAKGGRDLMSISEDSPKYKQALAIAQAVLHGDIVDPTNGADHFLNPQLNAELAKKDGRKAVPDWATGDGLRIGDHVFYKKGYGG